MQSTKQVRNIVYKYVDMIDPKYRKLIGMSTSIWTNKNKDHHTVKVEMPKFIPIWSLWEQNPIKGVFTLEANAVTNLESIMIQMETELNQLGYITKRKRENTMIVRVYDMEK